ncbi:uncharacterized protein LOC141718383 [Apium graveolens]|uniref:uncharacterized protein LOC141718383 n=1 Tax=Apium graveolens TaxID=4045 RepID=UPI003D7AE164
MLANEIVSDPTKSKPINEYEPAIRDDVRRRYVQMGPCKPTSHIFPLTKYGDRQRSFQASWLNNWDWLECSSSEMQLFVFGVIFLEIKEQEIKHSQRRDSEIRKRKSITRKFSRGIEVTGAAYRTRLTASVDVAWLLLGLGLAFRGNDESSMSIRKGNFLEILSWLSQFLQQKDQNIIEAMNLVTNVKRQLKNLRDNGWDMEDNMAGRIRGKNATTYYNHFRVIIYCQVIDCIIQEMDNRFSESNTELLMCIACLDPKNGFSNFCLSRVVRLVELYPLEFSPSDQMEFKEEMKTWIFEMRNNERFSKLNNIGEIAKNMVEVDYHRTFCLVYLLVELFLILPVATSSVECTFSAMNVVNSNLRNKMGDDFLIDCLVSYIEKDLFTAIDNEAIMQNF